MIAAAKWIMKELNSQYLYKSYTFIYARQSAFSMHTVIESACVKMYTMDLKRSNRQAEQEAQLSPRDRAMRRVN